MMRFWGKTFVVGLIGLGTQNTIFANDDAQISRYEQAKLRLLMMEMWAIYFSSYHNV
ncbi:hypothetical protein HPFOLIGI_02699 [Mannheimia haemolytica]